jgi:hypothetical protein
MKNFLLDVVNDHVANTLGAATLGVSFVNSMFQVLNPVLTGIFYIASIGWLCIQMYYKIKNKK